MGEGEGGRIWENSIETCMKWSEVVQSCPTLCDPMEYSLQGSSVHRIFQAGVLEWVAISFFRASSRPRDRTQVSCVSGRHFTVWATREDLKHVYYCMKIDDQCKFDAWSKAPNVGALGQPRGLGWGGRFRIGGIHVYLWLIHVDIWQKPSQYCKVIMLQSK